MLPLASVLVAFMAGISVLDALSGHALLGREIVHLLQIAGLGCLWVLARRHRRPLRGRPAGMTLVAREAGPGRHRRRGGPRPPRWCWF